MQIKAFQYFDTIVEKKTLSAAAEALFISQPALSQQLRKMEEEGPSSFSGRATAWC